MSYISHSILHSFYKRAPKFDKKSIHEHLKNERILSLFMKTFGLESVERKGCTVYTSIYCSYAILAACTTFPRF